MTKLIITCAMLLVLATGCTSVAGEEEEIQREAAIEQARTEGYEDGRLDICAEFSYELEETLKRYDVDLDFAEQIVSESTPGDCY